MHVYKFRTGILRIKLMFQNVLFAFCLFYHIPVVNHIRKYNIKYCHIYRFSIKESSFGVSFVRVHNFQPNKHVNKQKPHRGIDLILFLLYSVIVQTPFVSCLSAFCCVLICKVLMFEGLTYHN